eukprot:scaffold476_cov77-Skeletonema_marinoi.AAC.8
MKINTATTAATIFLLTTPIPITAKIGGSKTSKTSRDGGKSGKANLRSAALSVLLDADAAPIADSFSIARTEAPTAAALSNLSDAAPLAEGFVNVAAMGSSKSGKSESPTSKPSVSSQPTSAPSLSPSVSSQPSSEPTLAPSVSTQPTSGSKSSKSSRRY